MADLDRIKKIIAERNKEKNKEEQIRSTFDTVETKFPNMYKNFTNEQLETRKKELVNENSEYLKVLQSESNYRKATETDRSLLDKIGNTFYSSIEKTGQNLVNTPLTIINKLTNSDIETIKPSFEQQLSTYNKLTSQGAEKVALDVTGSIGEQVIPGVAAILTGGGSATAKAVPYALNFLNVGYGNYEEALNEGKTESQALSYGVLSGAMEVGLGAAIGSTLGGIYQKTPLSKTVNNATKNIIKSDSVRNYLSEILSEGGEEYLQEILNPVVRNITLDEQNEFKLITEDAIYAAFLGGLTSGIMNLPSTIVNKVNTNQMINDINNNINYDNLTVDQEINLLNNLKTTTENETQIKKIDTLIDDLNTFKSNTDVENARFSDFKKDTDTQIRSKQRALAQLESIDPLLRTETQQKQIDTLSNTIAELRKQKSEPVLKIDTTKQQSSTQKKMNNLKGKVNKNIDGYDYVVPTLYRGTNDTNISKGVARFGEGTYYTPSETRAKTYGKVTEYTDLENSFKNPYIQGTKYNDKMTSLLNDYKQSHPDLSNKIDMIIDNGMPITNSIIPQQDIKQLYLDAGYDSFIGGTNNKPEYVSFKNEQITQKSQIANNKEIDVVTETNFKSNDIPEKTINNAILDSIPKTKKLNPSLGEKIETETRKLIDKSLPIDKLADYTDNQDLKYKYFARNNVDAAVQFDIGEYQTDMNGDKIGKSLNDIFDNIENSHEFDMYMYAKHGIDRYNQGKPAFDENLTPDMLKEFVYDMAKKHPEFKTYSDEVLQYEKNLRNIMSEAGLISKETQSLLEEMYPEYVRIYRENNKNAPYTLDGKTIKVNSPVKTAKGGDSAIQPLKYALAKQTYEVKNAAANNIFGQSLAKSLKSIDSDISTDTTNLVKLDENYGYIYYDNGKQKIVPIDEALYTAISPTKHYEFEDTLFAKTISKASSVQRNLLTNYNVLFAFKNFIRDMGDAGFNSEYGLRFYTYTPQALSEMTNNGNLWQLYKSTGGYQNTQFDYQTGFDIKKNKFLGAIEKVNSLTEQYTRFVEFLATVENGGSLYEAHYNAMEVTTNFNRGSNITKALSRNGFNFLNASVQGMYKQYNNLRGANGVRGYTQLLTRAAVLGIAPAVLNHLLLNDDDDYQDLPTYVKDSNYLFKIGDNKFIKIPKARAMSILGNAARRVLSGESFEDYPELVLDQIGPNNPLKDNIFAPIMAVKDNISWNGYAIVPSRLEDLPASQQYDEGTTELAKTIGKIFNYSPMKIDYLIDQYSGVVGDITMPMMTEEADPNWLTAAFVVDSVITNNSTNKLYEEIENIKKQESTPDTELQSTYLNSMLYYVNQYYSHIRLVQSDTTLSDSEKTKQVKALKEELNNLAKQTLELKDNIIDKTYNGETYRQIGLQLYKYKDGKYTKVNTGTTTFRNILGYNVQQEAINQEIDAEGKIYTKIGDNYYEVNDDGTYNKLTSSTAINKAKIKLG